MGGAMMVPTATAMETASGRFVDLLQPDPDQIRAQDIAHHLALINRYLGATSGPVSVGAHSILVCDLLASQGLSRPTQLAGLLHDAPEAYMGDTIAPMKYALRLMEWDAYMPQDERLEGVPANLSDLAGLLARMEAKLAGAIGEALDVDPDTWDRPAVKLADMWALKIEAQRYTHSRGANWHWPGELPNSGRIPATVGTHFEDRWYEVREEWMKRYRMLSS